MPSGRASERWGRVPVKCFSRYWELQPVPASTWIRAAISDDMAGIFPGLVSDDDAMELFELWLTEPDMPRRCRTISQRALERASRREWHWAMNLCKEIDEAWTHLNGLLVREGVRADRTSLSDYLDAAYTLFQEKLKPDDFKAFEGRLRKLPSGIISKPRMSSKAELLAFAKD